MRGICIERFVIQRSIQKFVIQKYFDDQMSLKRIRVKDIGMLNHERGEMDGL